MEIALIIVSDRSYNGEREDRTGPLLQDYLKSRGGKVEYLLLPDDKEMIKEGLLRFSRAGKELILTSGGTGFAPRDLTPEATKEVLEREAPGLSELIRYKNAANSKNSYLSRGVCGTIGRSVIINLPGSPGGALDCYKIVEELLNHACSLLQGEVKDCAKLE